MGMKSYLKRAIKYIIKEHKVSIVKPEIVQKTPSEMLKNKNILITGGGSGLGYYIAKKLSAEGAKVIITGRNEEKLKKAVNEIENDVEYMVYDVKKCDSNFIKTIYDKLGKIDCVINNAGISLHEGNMLNVTIEGFQNQFDTNLKGAYFLAQEYIKKIKEKNQKEGNIIFISSERGKQCDDIPYGLTKVAMNSLVEGMSRRFYKEGIRVNAIAPGITASDMTNIKRDEDLYCDYNASGRFFMPEEIAETVAFMVSDCSKCISGEVIHCDAGNHLNPWFD